MERNALLDRDDAQQQPAPPATTAGPRPGLLAREQKGHLILLEWQGDTANTRPAPMACPRRGSRPDWYGIGVLILLLSSLVAVLEAFVHMAG